METNLYKKAHWHCRRGLQELDLILLPFVENNFNDLNKTEQLSFLTILEYEDVDLMDWLVYGVTPPQEFITIIELVRDKYLINEST